MNNFEAINITALIINFFVIYLVSLEAFAVTEFD